MNTNFKVIGLTRLGMKPESTGPKADALTTRPSELLKQKQMGDTLNEYLFLQFLLRQLGFY